MKAKISFLLAGLIVAFGCVATQAQEQKETTHKKVRTIKGCLTKADDPKEYNLTGIDGSTWEVKSDSVKLAPHVGHTVAVTGEVSNAALHGTKEDIKGEAKEHGIDKSSTEHGHIAVTNLKMVSESCEK